METESIFLLPGPAVVAVVVGGFGLALYRPYWGFLFGVFLMTGLDFRTLIFSRMSGAGEYFNVLDSALVVCISSMLADLIGRGRAFRMPPLAAGILVVLLFGFANGALTVGYSYETLRGLRWAVNLPLCYVVACNLVNSHARAASLFWTLFVGAVVAQLQHITIVLNEADIVVGRESSIRLLGFVLSHSETWLAAGPYLVRGKMRKPWLQLAAAVLFLVSNVLHQTRSIGIAAVGASVLYFGWLSPGNLRSRMSRYAALVGAIGIAYVIALPGIGLTGFSDSYENRLQETSAVDKTTRTRGMAIDIEFDDWLEGNVLWGNGIAYFSTAEHHRGSISEAAYGHIGYVTYLSQLGLIGFFVYAVWFPVSTLRRVYHLLRQPDLPAPHRHLVALAGVLVLYWSIVQTMGAGLLGIEVLAGLLAGCVAATKTIPVAAQGRAR